MISPRSQRLCSIEEACFFCPRSIVAKDGPDGDEEQVFGTPWHRRVVISKHIKIGACKEHDSFLVVEEEVRGE